MQRVQRDTNIKRFKDRFGVAPVVYWEDLQTTKLKMVDGNSEVPVRIDISQQSCTLKTFLESIHFLRKYDMETDRAGH